MGKNYHLDKIFLQNPLDFEGIYVSQIGRLFCDPTTVINTHQHSHLFELTVVTDGVGTITTNSVPIKVERGDIYLSLPCDTHKIETDPQNPLKFDFFAFNCDIESIHNELERISEGYHPSNMRIFRNEQIRHLIANAIAELNDEKEYSKELLASFFKQIIIYTIRGFSNIEPVRHRATVTASEILCYKIMNYIDTHIYTLKNLSELSKIMGYSYGYLSSVFKKTTGDTIANYYYNRKLETVRLLLLENRLKITEISEMLNYSSVYALSKAFSNRFGASPRNYRNEHLKR